MNTTVYFINQGSIAWRKIEEALIEYCESHHIYIQHCQYMESENDEHRFKIEYPGIYGWFTLKVNVSAFEIAEE